MIVRTKLNAFSHETLLQQIEHDPQVKHLRSISPTPNHFIFHTVNEILNDKDRHVAEVIECQNAGYDVAWYSNSTSDITPHGYPLEYFEYQAGAYHENAVATESQQWNCIDKGLYQPGKTSKITRLAILKYLDDSNELHKLDYSLKVLDPNDPTIKPDVVESQTRLINELGTNTEYFLGLNRSMDINMNDICANGVQHYVGYPYQTHIYENTGWSLITESNTGFNIINPYESGKPRSYQDGPMISEKTYRPIMNSHPIVIVGEWGLHQHLNSLGYQTFEKFYGVDLDKFYPMAQCPSSDNTRRQHHDFESIRNVVSQFYNNISANQDEVREMVTHNKQLLIANYNKTKQWLLDKDEYVIGDNGDRHVVNLHDHLWMEISYRNNNGKDIEILRTTPERYLINLDQLK